MKKALLLVAVLALISSLAFAEFGTGMWSRTTFNAIEYSAVEDSDITQSIGPSWGNPGPRGGIFLWWFNDKLKYQVRWNYNGHYYDVENESWGARNDGFVQAWGEMYLIPDMLTVQIGYNEENEVFRVETGLTDNNDDMMHAGRFTRWGIIVTVTPMAGLKIAAQYRLPDAVIGDDGPIGGVLEDNVLNTGIGLSYTVPEMVMITAGTFIQGEDWEDNLPSLESPAAVRMIMARVNFLMVPDLQAWLGIRYNGLEPAEDISASLIQALIFAKYTMGDMYAALKLNMLMNMEKDEDYPVNDTMQMDVGIEGGYNLGNMTAGLLAHLSMYLSAEDEVEGTTDNMHVKIYPFLKVPDFSFTTGFKIDMDTADDESMTVAWYNQVDWSFW